MTYDVNTPGKAVQGKKKIKALQNVKPEVHCFCLGQEMSNIMSCYSVPLRA